MHLLNTKVITDLSRNRQHYRLYIDIISLCSVVKSYLIGVVVVTAVRRLKVWGLPPLVAATTRLHTVGVIV